MDRHQISAWCRHFEVREGPGKENNSFVAQRDAYSPYVPTKEWRWREVAKYEGVTLARSGEVWWSERLPMVARVAPIQINIEKLTFSQRVEFTAVHGWHSALPWRTEVAGQKNQRHDEHYMGVCSKPWLQGVIFIGPCARPPSRGLEQPCCSCSCPGASPDGSS